MSDGPNADVWSTLRTQRTGSEDQIVTTPVVHHGAPTALMYAMDEGGSLCLLIGVEEIPTDPIHPDLRGLRVRTKSLSFGRFITVIAEPACERVFGAVCADIIIAIVDQHRQPAKAVASVIKAWASLWKPATTLMSATAQIGLFGELLSLQKIVMPVVGPSAVVHWSGPDKERHDFVGERIHLEVKTTTKSHHEHEISRYDQLRVPAGRRLFVISILAESSVAGTMSLATQVDQITDLLRGEPAYLDDFLTKLGKCEWTEELRHAPELQRFHLRKSGIFPVDSEFPRIPDDFAMPDGVTGIKYTVDLANLAPWSAQDLHDEIRGGF